MKEADKGLWQRFRDGDRAAYEKLVEYYMPIVKMTVGRIALNLPGFVEYEDLYSAGCMGLLSALQRYEPDSSAKFQTYAITRVRGAIFDELRSRDLLGRVTRERVTRIHQAEQKLRKTTGDCTAEEIAVEAGLSLDEYYDAILGERASHIVSLSEPVDENQGTLGEMLAGKGEFSPDLLRMEEAELLEWIENLMDDREKMLVVLYYHDELTLKEIGELMGVSESRVSQIHAEMITRLRREMKKVGVV